MNVVVTITILATAFALLAMATPATAQAVDALADWRKGVKISPVIPDANVHTIHTYFNTCPESPDGKLVLFFRSTAADAGVGEVCTVERATGKITVLAREVRTEDAHRAAVQQWVCGGRRVVYQNERDGHWLVMGVDADGKNEKVLARERLLGFGQPNGSVVPMFGRYWEAAEHRDLELLDAETGAITTGVTADAVRDAFPDWFKQNFGDRRAAVFFGILSPDGTRVLFKLSTPASGKVRSADASHKAGFFCYSLTEKRFLQAPGNWGHPFWHPDSKTLIQQKEVLIDTDTGVTRQIAGIEHRSGDHPSISPDGKLWLKDAIATLDGRKAKDWGVYLNDLQSHSEVQIAQFDNSGGAASWRVSHPHPVFSPDGRRIYYNVSSGQWTRLFVAEATHGH